MFDVDISNITNEPLNYYFGEQIAHYAEEWLRQQERYKDHDMYVQDIYYFCWDKTPAYYLFLVEDGKPVKNRKYVELVVKELGENGYTEKIDFANHGFPCMSNNVWTIEL